MTMETMRLVENLPVLTQLERAILQTKCPVLVTEDVREYQRRELNRRVRLLRLKAFLKIPLPCLAAGAEFLRLAFKVPFNLSWIPIGFLAGVSIAAGILFTEAIFSQPRTFWASWGVKEWGFYRQMGGTVPEEIFQRRKQLHKLCPSAVFAVETLGDDPFLCVSDRKGEWYYIGVWDERRFR